MPYQITEHRREQYREMSLRSQERKRLALQHKALQPIHPINVPYLNPSALMPQLPPCGLSALSLFSGGGGFDLGFERAGFAHIGSYDILNICGATLTHNRPSWRVYSGEQGDIRHKDWLMYKDKFGFAIRTATTAEAFEPRDAAF